METRGELTAGSCPWCAWRARALDEAKQTITGLRHALARWRERAQARPAGLVRRVLTPGKTHWGYDLVEVWATEYPDTTPLEELIDRVKVEYGGKIPLVGDPPPSGEAWRVVRLETRDATWLVHRMTAWGLRRS